MRKRIGQSIDPCGTPHFTRLAVVVFSCNIDDLLAVVEITLEPFERKTPYPVVKEFLKENIVVNCVESFFKVNENTNSNKTMIHFVCNVRYKVGKGECSIVVFAKAILGT